MRNPPRKRPALLFAVIACCSILIACDKDPAAVDRQVPVMNVSPMNPWAGGIVTLAPWIFPQDTPAIYVDGKLAPFTVDTSIVVKVEIPGDAEGPTEIRLGSPTGRLLATVNVAGFTGHSALARTSDWRPFVWPRNGNASVLLAHGDTLVRYEPGQQRTTIIPGPGTGAPHDIRMPGLTPDPNVFLFEHEFTESVEHWRMAPTLSVLDTSNIELIRRTAVLSSGVYVVTGPQLIRTFDPAGQFIDGQTSENTQGIALSPDGSIAIVNTHTVRTPGLIAIGVTGRVQYTVPEIATSHSTLFSATGDTAWVAGNGTGGRGIMAVINGHTGAIHRIVDLGDTDPDVITADPNGRWLYVGTISDTPQMYVIDRATMTVAGRVSVPGWVSCGYDCGSIPVAGPDGLFLMNYQQVATFSRPEDFLP